MQTTNELLTAALEYAARGWCIVPLYGIKDDGQCECGSKGCSGEQRNRGKHPRITKWQDNATNDLEKVESWFKQWPRMNIGVRLGPSSGIIDVEFDDEKGETTARELFGEVFTPSYRSGRSIHRIFKWTDGLPKLTIPKFKGLEFRIGQESKGAQSVFPPSRHWSGRRYEWLQGLTPNDLDIIELPEVVVALLFNQPEGGSIGDEPNGRQRSKRHQLYELKEVKEGFRDDTIYAEACALWREAISTYGDHAVHDAECQSRIFERLQALNLAKCRPPIEESVVLQKCNNAKAFIAKQTTESAEVKVSMKLTELGLEWRDKQYWPGAWKVETINSDPPMIRLFAPFLPKAYVELSPEQYDSAKKVHLAIFGATGTVFLDDGNRPWEAIWRGVRASKRTKGKSSRGLAAKLLEAAVRIDAPIDAKRETEIAQFISKWLYGDHGLKDKTDVSLTFKDVKFVRADDIWFRFDELAGELRWSPGKITRLEISNYLHGIGAVSEREVVLGKRLRYTVMNKESIKLLASSAEGD